MGGIRDNIVGDDLNGRIPGLEGRGMTGQAVVLDNMDDRTGPTVTPPGTENVQTTTGKQYPPPGFNKIYLEEKGRCDASTDATWDVLTPKLCTDVAYNTSTPKSTTSRAGGNYEEDIQPLLSVGEQRQPGGRISTSTGTVELCEPGVGARDDEQRPVELSEPVVGVNVDDSKTGILSYTDDEGGSNWHVSMRVPPPHDVK